MIVFFFLAKVSSIKQLKLGNSTNNIYHVKQLLLLYNYLVVVVVVVVEVVDRYSNRIKFKYKIILAV